MMDVRRLAAVDMHGSAGRPWRRRLILAEFVAGAVLGLWLGLPLSLSAEVWGWRLFGLWVLGVGLNYVPLALHALRLSRSGQLDRELAGVDIPAELHHYTLVQAWVMVPLAIVVFALRGRRPQTG